MEGENEWRRERCEKQRKRWRYRIKRDGESKRSEQESDRQTRMENKWYLYSPKIFSISTTTVTNTVSNRGRRILSFTGEQFR